MKLGRLAAVATALGLLGSSAMAGNGSNFWHYQNGLDYYFFYAAPPLPGSAVARCFPGAINHAPTKVVAATDPNVGTYASKIETLWFNIVAGGGFGGTPIQMPYVCLWSNSGSCHVVTAGGVNWGLFTGIGAGMPVLGGPLNGGGLILHAAFAVVFPNSFPLGFINTLRFDFVSGGPGLPSAATIPEGNTVALTSADAPAQGPGAGQYWTGSVDDRKVCTAVGNSMLLVNTGGGFAIGQPFIAAGVPTFLPIEWGNYVSTIDAVVELNTTNPGGGPSGLNAHAAMAVPYDAGNNGVMSLTGTTIYFPTAGEVFGVHSYDDNNVFGGSNHLSMLNFSGLRAGWPGATAPMCPTAGGIYHWPAPGDIPGGTFPVTGGPNVGAGGVLSLAIPQHPRSTGVIDSVTNNLLANPTWTGATVHGTAPFGINFPGYPAPVKNGGSAGNNGGFQIPIPGGLGALVGVEVAMWQLCLNGPGTAVAKTANNGHSHTNIVPIGLAP
jgi:hypothetical protein